VNGVAAKYGSAFLKVNHAPPRNKAVSQFQVFGSVLLKGIYERQFVTGL
jgi:hypothetical protein